MRGKKLVPKTNTNSIPNNQEPQGSCYARKAAFTSLRARASPTEFGSRRVLRRCAPAGGQTNAKLPNSRVARSSLSGTVRLFWFPVHMPSMTDAAVFVDRPRQRNVVRPGWLWSSYLDEEMLKAGLAEVYQGSGAVYGRKGKDGYMKIMEKAKSKGIGIWSDPDRESAAEYKRRTKAD